MVLRAVLLFACLLLLLTTVAQAQDDELKKEYAELQGTWKLVAREGKPFPKPPAGTHLLTITGKQFKVDLNDLPKDTGDLVGWGSGGGVFAIDPSKSPKQVDDNQGAPHWLGIYKLEKDKLSILFRTGERPKSFDDKERATFLIFERVKK